MADAAETIQTTTETPAPDAVASAPADTPASGAEAPAEADTSLLGGEGADDPAPAAEGDPAGPPEAYELAAPEGVTLDPTAVELATPVFKELGLTNEQASKLVPVAAEWAKSLQEKGQQAIMSEVVAQRKAWAEEAQSDPDIGGAKFSETMALAAKGLDTLGYPKGSQFRSFLTDSGLGNHPEMIRAFRKIGEAIGEDNNFVRADGAAPIEKNPARIMYPNNPPKGA